MVSTDINGEPILIFGLSEVRILEKWYSTLGHGLDRQLTPDENRVMEKISRFLNTSECLQWEQQTDAQ